MRSEAAKKAPKKALSGALCADRSLGQAWRRPQRHAEGGDRILRPAARHRHVAKSRSRVLPARQAQGPRRRPMGRPPHPCDRRRRHGRRHRGVVRVAWLHRQPRRHEAGAARRRDQARRRALRQDRPRRPPQGARRARSADPRSQGRRRRVRRPDHRGGAGKARPQAEGLCRHRAEDEARRDPRHQHVEHSARTIARRPAAAGAARRHPLLQSGVAHAARRGGQPRQGRRRGAGRCARLPRPHRPPARAGQERAGLPGQPRADALPARSHGDARRGHQEGNHRQGRRRLRHADGPDRARRPGRPRHLPARRRDAEEQQSATCPTRRNGSRTRSPRANSARRPARVFTTGRTTTRSNRTKPPRCRRR